MSDVPLDAERVRAALLRAFGLTGKTLAMNEALCVKVALERLDAPDEETAKQFVLACLNLLIGVSDRLKHADMTDLRAQHPPAGGPH